MVPGRGSPPASWPRSEGGPTTAPAPPPTPPTPKAETAPEINLGGTDSLSSLIARGSQIIPPAADARFRNREPIYPNEAARLGQSGLVVVQVHVGVDGRAEEVDIERSSGYRLLDNAARDAIITWRFRPAIRGGEAVQSTISIGVDYNLR